VTELSDAPASYDDLTAVFLNCTLKPTSIEQRSHTQLLMDRCIDIMRKVGIGVTNFRVVDHKIAFGVYPDMTEHGWDVDQWPAIQAAVMDADILVIGTPIWLGEKSSVCNLVIERLYGSSGILNERGQYAYYGKAGGCLVTGNEDGIKHCAMNILYSLGHLGYTIPPQADAGWIGEAGPGASYGDEAEDGSRTGFDNDFVNRNTTFMTWNLIHTARMLRDAGGLPAFGNVRPKWFEGERWGFEDHPNPEYR
jgi:multimeric flavodoxin WrbA